MRDLGDHEMLERLAIFVGPGVERYIECSVQRPLDAGVEEIEFRIGALLLPDRAMKGGEEESHQRVFKDAEVRDDGFGIRSNVSGDIGIVDDRAVRLRGNFQELPEWIEPSDNLLGHDLLFQIGQRIRPEVRLLIFVSLQRVDPR